MIVSSGLALFLWLASLALHALQEIRRKRRLDSKRNLDEEQSKVSQSLLDTSIN